MRLLKIGRDASCDIVLHSDKVSSLHAEMTVLNNGDILLEDKNSKNGTFLMNKPIKPGTSVSVRRGDAIRFGDVELMWNQIPMQENNSNFKALFGIGTNFRNEIQISGNTVSRFHATLKIGKDGKAYIQDHSKNGTTVNGTKITFGQNVRIKRNYAIACGGVPVELKQFIPGPKGWTKVIGAMAIAAILIGAIFLVKHFITPTSLSDEQLYIRHRNSVVLVTAAYHYKVTAGNLDISKALPTEVIWNGRQPVKNINVYEGTAFWVSSDGKLVTNLHITRPWLFEPEVMSQLSDWYKTKMAELAQLDIRFNAYIDQIKVEGVLDYIGIIQNEDYIDGENLIKCRELAAGDDTNMDVALIQSVKRTLPNSYTSYVNIDSIAVNNEEIKVGSHIYTLGFPLGTKAQYLKSDKGLQIYGRGGNITQTPKEYTFGFDAASFHGASGSPVFDKRGYLIGVLSSGFDITQGFNFAIKAKYVKELIDKSNEK